MYQKPLFWFLMHAKDSDKVTQIHLHYELLQSQEQELKSCYGNTYNEGIYILWMGTKETIQNCSFIVPGTSIKY